jgi:hypothetical protein
MLLRQERIIPFTCDRRSNVSSTCKVLSLNLVRVLALPRQGKALTVRDHYHVIEFRTLHGGTDETKRHKHKQKKTIRKIVDTRERQTAA